MVHERKKLRLTGLCTSSRRALGPSCRKARWHIERHLRFVGCERSLHRKRAARVVWCVDGRVRVYAEGAAGVDCQRHGGGRADGTYLGDASTSEPLVWVCSDGAAGVVWGKAGTGAGAPQGNILRRRRER